MTLKSIFAYYLFFLLCALLYGCEGSSQQDQLPEFFGGQTNVEVFSEASEADVTFSFIKEREFGDSGLLYISHSDNIGVDDTDRVFIENQKSIHIYGESGSHIGSIGREGRGPGEFQTIHNFQIRNDKLYVYDANLSRITVFDTDALELEREIPIPIIDGLRGLGEFGLIDDDQFIVGMQESRRSDESAITERFMHYYLIDGSGQPYESAIAITELADYFEISNQRGTSYPPIPFDRTTLFTVSATGKIYFLWTDQIAIKLLDSQGNFLNGIFYPYSNVKINDDSEFPIYFEVLGLSISDTKNILGDRLPDSHPAVSHFFVDDEERLWLSTITENSDHYEWFVLEESGELITKFEWPRSDQIEIVKNGKMYTRQIDEETDLQQIVRYRIEIEELL